MNLRRTLLGATVALGALALIATSNQANAGAFAFADLQVNTFEVQSVTGNTLGGTPNGELTNACGVNCPVPGAPGTGGVPGGNINVTNANDSFTSIAAIGASTNTQITNGGVACVGTCPANPYAFQAAPPITSVFSQAAAKLNPTVGGPTFAAPVISVNGSVAGGATAETAAQTQLLGFSSGQASSTIGLNSGFNFSIRGTGTTTIALTFNAIVNLIAGLDPAGGTSQASSALSFTITDQTTGNVVFLWAPNGNGTAAICAPATCEIIQDAFSLNASAVNDTLPGATSTDPNNGIQGAFEAEITLNNGDLYTFGINHQTQTLVSSFETRVVPEPATLVLFGAGLLGMGWISRRKKLS